MIAGSRGACHFVERLNAVWQTSTYCTSCKVASADRVS